jgi:hypothetical protein
MIMETVTGAVVLAGVISAIAVHRSRHYRRLAAVLEQAKPAADAWGPELLPQEAPSFEKRITAIPNFLPEEQFETLRREVEALPRPERSYVPAHKKGGTIAYETMIAHAPAVVSLYHSRAMRDFVSRVTGVEVAPTPLHDQSSLSLLIYERPGDHIGWHYDHNFYQGRHFTVLLAVVNTGSGAGGLSHARLSAMAGGVETGIETAPDTLVVFEGARVVHKASPILAGERRVLISMTYCADARASAAQAVARRVKDTAFFGVRALWT